MPTLPEAVCSRLKQFLWPWRSAKILKEIMDTEQCGRLESLTSLPRSEAMMDLKRVFNVGPSFAATLMGKGIMSVAELRRQVRCASYTSRMPLCAPHRTRARR
jgi:hypothetical protein